MAREGSLMMEVDHESGTIQLHVDDKFRWMCQKALWEGSKIVCDAIGANAYRGRLKRSDLDGNSRRLDEASMAKLGVEYIPGEYCRADALFGELLGARITGGWPNSRADQLTYILEKIRKGSGTV